MSASTLAWNARSSGVISSTERSFFAPVSTICAYIACPPRRVGSATGCWPFKTIHFCDDNGNFCIGWHRGTRAMNSRPHAAVTRWIRRELETAPPRAKSLVVTVWGDALAPHGGAVWLSGLIRLLAPLGLNERLVRTSVYRLARDGWLASRQAGRRS